MKIIEALNKFDVLVPNDYSQSEKIAWLSQVDGIIKNEIIDTHVDHEEVVFNGYTDETPLDTNLIVGEPYDALYLAFLEGQVCYYNHEFTKYNNSMQVFRDTLGNFRNYYNRIHAPIRRNINYI